MLNIEDFTNAKDIELYINLPGNLIHITCPKGVGYVPRFTISGKQLKGSRIELNISFTNIRNADEVLKFMKFKKLDRNRIIEILKSRIIEHNKLVEERNKIYRDHLKRI